MNKLTKLYLIVPFLILSPMSVTAKTGWWATPDGKNHTLYPKKLKQYTDTTKRNKERINELTKDIKSRNLKGERGERGEDGRNGKNGDVGADGARGHSGVRGKQGRTGSKGAKGDVGSKGLTGDSFYANNYGNMNLLSVMAVGNAVSNMPAPTSNGFFTSVGFSDLGGEHASAIGIHYVDDVLSYKATYGHGGHERSIGFGIGIGFQL